MTDLHSYHAVDEEDKDDEEGDPGQGLEGFDKSPEEGSYSLSFREKFDESHHSEQSEEADRYHVVAGLK